MDELEPGAVLGPGYVVQAQLGHSSSSVVYRALDPDGARTVAIKILVGGKLYENAPARFQREADAYRRLRAHDGVVALLDVGVLQTGEPFLVTEHIDGETLAEHLRSVGTLEPAEIAVLGRRLADVLEHVHQHDLVHGDVKPSNVYLPDGELARAKLGDFGLVDEINQETGVTAGGIVLGTLLYMSPEQITGDSRSSASDVWGLGAVLYECAYGHPPFTGTTLPKLVSGIVGQPLTFAPLAGSLDQTLARALTKDPRARASTPELARKFDKLARSLLGGRQLARRRAKPSPPSAPEPHGARVVAKSERRADGSVSPPSVLERQPAKAKPRPSLAARPSPPPAVETPAPLVALSDAPESPKPKPEPEPAAEQLEPSGPAPEVALSDSLGLGPADDDDDDADEADDSIARPKPLPDPRPELADAQPAPQSSAGTRTLVVVLVLAALLVAVALLTKLGGRSFALIIGVCLALACSLVVAAAMRWGLGLLEQRNLERGAKLTADTSALRQRADVEQFMSRSLALTLESILDKSAADPSIDLRRVSLALAIGEFQTAKAGEDQHAALERAIAIADKLQEQLLNQSRPWYVRHKEALTVATAFAAAATALASTIAGLLK